MENLTQSQSKRLLSLDTLRGFDMFWIMGGDSIFPALAALTGWPILKWWAGQLEHVPWHGFHAYDMIFPLFLFIAGISFPFSLAKRYHGPENRRALYRHIIGCGLLLVLLGIIYNNGIAFRLLQYALRQRLGSNWLGVDVRLPNLHQHQLEVSHRLVLGNSHWLLGAFARFPGSRSGHL